MAAFFIIGEKKIRPGVYFRYQDYGLPPTAGVDDGVCAAVFRSDWGPVGKPIYLESYEDIGKLYGEQPAVPMEQFRGGARRMYCVRLGSVGGAGPSGNKGAYDINDTAGTAVLRLTMKYPGSRPFLLTIRPTLEDPNVDELLLLDGTQLLERYKFDGTADSLVNAVAFKESDYFTLANMATSTNDLAAIDQVAIPPGTDPAINAAAYSAAFEALEAYRWNVLSIDTSDNGIQTLMQMYLNRIYNAGKFVMGVVGEGKGIPFETRMRRAAAFNDYQMVYVGNGFIDSSGKEYDGYLAAARIAGMIAGTPSDESLTHLSVTGAVDLSESLSNRQYERALQSGMLLFSTSALDTIWVEQGINSLVTLDSKEDAGWKKIKRVKVRFELMQRLTDTVEVLVGRVNNDPDGRMTVIQASNGVCNTMVAEKKLLPGAHCEIDPDNKPEGDSAWFLVFADDIDALEKLYFTFKFRFSPNTEG